MFCVRGFPVSRFNRLLDFLLAGFYSGLYTILPYRQLPLTGHLCFALRIQREVGDFLVIFSLCFYIIYFMFLMQL